MRYRYGVLVLLVFLSMLTYLDRVCIGLAAPRIRAELGIPLELWGWVFAAFAFSYAAFEIPSGALGDRIGPRKILTRVVLWWSLFTALTGSVSSFPLLLACQFFFGAGEAGAYPNAAGSISRWFPALQRARAQGLVWMASRAGGALAPLIVIPIQMRYGWRASFWLFAGLGLVWTAVWWWWYRDSPSQKPGVSRIEIEEVEGSGPPKPRVHGLPWVKVFKSPNLWAIIVMYHAFCYGSFFFLSWWPTYLQQGRGFAESEVKAYLSVPFILGALANLAGGFASDFMVKKIGLKWGRRSVALAGLSTSALFILASTITTSKVLVVAFMAIGFAASDFMLPTAWAVCLDIGRKYAGAVTGTMNTAGQIGSFTVSVLVGYVVKAFHSYDAPLIPIGLMMALSAAMWLKIDPTKQLVPEDEVAPAKA